MNTSLFSRRSFGIHVWLFFCEATAKTRLGCFACHRVGGGGWGLDGRHRPPPHYELFSFRSSTPDGGGGVGGGGSETGSSLNVRRGDAVGRDGENAEIRDGENAENAENKKQK